MERNEVIKKIKEIENISKYAIIGGAAMFNREYPNLLNFINEYSEEMQVYVSNTKLLAKLTYFKKYDGDINKITVNNKVMVYSRKLFDFKATVNNSTQKQWDDCNQELLKISDLYTKEETVNLLKDDYQKYFGKAGNRKLIRDNKKLYLSLYHHTSQMDSLNKNLNKFTMRIIILINEIDIYCSKHNRLKFWKFIEGKLNIICDQCSPKYPSIEWFQNMYGDEWQKYVDERKRDLGLIKANSKEWFVQKNGEEQGNKLYIESVQRKIESITKLKGNRYSKISQELFWSVYNQLNNKNNIYFQELNQEFVIRIPEIFNYNKVVMVVDFIQNKKIIEYNGKYWHSDVDDEIRYNILKNMDYEILTITSDDYNRSSKKEEIIDRCINFLQC